jgi:hypothetical protein
MSKKDQANGNAAKPAEDASPTANAEQPMNPEDGDGMDRDLDFGSIGSQLRGLYDKLLEEPIPDRFVELLKKLESKEPGKK